MEENNNMDGKVVSEVSSALQTKCQITNNNTEEEDTPKQRKSTKLFGGAITTTLPNTFIDTSEYREIPDHQEVYLGPNASDGCFIMELLDYQTSVEDEDSMQFFFDDLAHCNDAIQDGDGGGGLVTQRVIRVGGESGSDLSKSQMHPLLKELGISVTQTTSSQKDDDAADSSDITVCLGIGRQRVPTRTSKHPFMTPPPLDPNNSNNNKDETTWVKVEMCLIRLPMVQTDLLVSLSKPSDEVEQRTNNDKHYGNVFCDICNHVKIVDWSLFG